MSTLFSPILRRTIERVPGALGVIFADWDGEAVDSVGVRSRDEMLLIGAHYGVILASVQQLLKLFHFGEALEIVLEHDRVDLLVTNVGRGYYVVLAIAADAHLGTALREARLCASELRKEVI